MNDICASCGGPNGEHWECVPFLEMRLQLTETAADVLAKAAKTHLRYVISLNPNVSLDGLHIALAAYEKLRHVDICTLCGRRYDEHGGDPLGC